MVEPTFIVADPAAHRAALIALNIEYMAWLAAEGEAFFGISAEESTGMSIEAYVASALDKICGEAPPRGVFYLVERDGQLAGMGGLRWSSPGAAEIKRVYVRPDQRGAGLGAAIVRRLLADARAFGYGRVILDTAPFMHAAHRLYEAEGFRDCAPNPDSEVPAFLHAQWRFMEKDLAADERQGA